MPGVPTLPTDPLEEFHHELQELVVDQARRMINLNLYNKALLSTLPVALLGTDENGRIRTVNHAAEDILDCREKSLRDRNLAGLFSEGSSLAEKIKQVLDQGRPFHMSSKSLTLASGRRLVGNLYLQPLRDDEQQICGLLMTIEDQTYFHYLHNAFKRYVPPSVSEIIARDPQSLKLGGEEKILSVLFSDLVGFTSLSEGHAPHEMVELLSDYFAAMTGHVFTFEGTLKEYVGDELMAIFGAPVPQRNHALKACLAALSMQNELRQLRRTWPPLGRPALRARIGINSGPMLVGNLGSPYRFSYGVVGDQVNLASRLEGLAGLYGVDILIGENTVELVRDELAVREIDWVRVKGREQHVRIFELIDRAGRNLPPDRRKANGCYARGLSEYRRQNWQKALGNFDQAGCLRPSDRPAEVMAERCRIFQESPPPEDWEGVFEHHSKK